MNDFSRLDRIDEQVMQELALLVQREVKDPRLQDVVIRAVEVTRDLSHAKVFFTVFGKNKDEVEEQMKAFHKAKGFFRSELAKRLQLRTTPQLRFIYDESSDNAARIEELLMKARKS